MLNYYVNATRTDNDKCLEKVCQAVPLNLRMMI